MKTASLVRFTFPKEDITKWTVRGFIRSMRDLVQRQGGKMWEWKTDGGVEIRVHDCDHVPLNAAISAFVDKAVAHHMAVSIAEPQPVPVGLESEGIEWGSIGSAKLTKRLVMSLPEGAYIYSNNLRINARVGPSDTRDGLWELVKRKRAANKLCYIGWASSTSSGKQAHLFSVDDHEPAMSEQLLNDRAVANFFTPMEMTHLGDAQAGTATILEIAFPNEDCVRWAVGGFVRAISSVIEAKGGVVWHWKTDTGLGLRTHNADEDFLEDSIDAFVRAAHGHRMDLSITKREMPLPNLANGTIAWGSISTARMTRRLLFALPAGAYVSANGFTPGQDFVRGRVDSLESREELWQRAKRARVNGRLCHIRWGDDCKSEIVPWR